MRDHPLIFSPPTWRLTSLLRAADLALYRAKALGKGRCTLASRKTRKPNERAPGRLSA